jgi:hypothetical protein
MEKHLMKYVHPTGFWYKEMAIHLHLDSIELKDWLIKFLKNDQDKVIYDLGCGTGYYLKELHAAGYKKVIGIEADPCKLYEEFPILSFNLTSPIDLSEKGIVICLEVGEHIPEEYEYIVLDNLTNLSDSWLIISWALPGQIGIGHFNCKSNEYIINEIESRGFQFMQELTKEARQYPIGATSYFQNTLMIFRKYDS